MNRLPLLLIGALASAQPGPKRVAVFDLTLTDVKPALARKADAVLRSLTAQREPGSEILAPGPAADCAIVECFVSMGKEMAAKEVVAGRLSSMGKTLILELKRIDVVEDRAVATTVRTFNNDEDALFGAMKDSVEELFRAAPPPSPERAAAEPARAGAHQASCRSVFTSGKWILCKLSEAVVYAWYGADGELSAKFPADSSGPWYFRQRNRVWKVTGTDASPSDEPWDPPPAPASQKSSDKRATFSVGGLEFRVTEAQIQVTWLGQGEELKMLNLPADAAKIVVQPWAKGGSTMRPGKTFP